MYTPMQVQYFTDFLSFGRWLDAADKVFPFYLPVVKALIDAHTNSFDCHRRS